MTANQQKGLVAILAARSMAAAARTCGFSRETLHRWLRDPDFRAELERQRQTDLFHALARTQSVTGQAVDVLGRALRHPSPRTRLRAAKAVLDLALEAHRLTLD